MVDGVLASCYADFHHDLAHFTMILMRKLSPVMEWIFGSDAGFPVYVSTLMNLGMSYLPSDHFLS